MIILFIELYDFNIIPLLSFISEINLFLGPIFKKISYRKYLKN